MKIIILLYLCLLLSIASLLGKENSEKKVTTPGKKQIGIITDISYFKELTTGLGFGYGKISTSGHHWFGYRLGLLAAYRFEKELYSLRPFYNIMGGSGGMLIGIATPIITDKSKYSVGISPQLGVSLFGYFDLFYRYNIYLNSEFNNHEIGFALLINFAD